MNLSFVKLSATGNDFILIDNCERELSMPDTDFFSIICRRRTGVGADGVLFVEKSSDFDFMLRYFNADGSETECGNGARAAAYYWSHKKNAAANLIFEFGLGVYEAQVDTNKVKIKLPPPHDLQKNINIIADDEFEEAGSINTGVPHFVLFVDDLPAVDILFWGKKYRNHPRFQSDGTNVTFVRIKNGQEVEIRTYERGVENETLSCGTGAVAAAIFANREQQLSFPVCVKTQGGDLFVHFDEHGNYYLAGEVTLVYDGSLNLSQQWKNKLIKSW